MTVRAFVDTNVWFYALSDSDFGKRDTANRLLDLLEQPIINGQVIRELGNNLLRKAEYEETEIESVIRQLYVDCLIVPDMESIFLVASRLRASLAISYWDSLIVATALEAGCETLYSEDLQHGQRIADQLILVNPFLP